MLKQRLSQKMIQKLSPQQIQVMKLLQIPTASLDQRIKEELESNPALEEGEEEFQEVFDLEKEDSGEQDSDDFELDDYINEYIEDDPVSYKLKDNSVSIEEDRNIPYAVERSFHEELERQLGLLNFQDERMQKIAQQIIGSIDDDGYLRREPIAIIDDLLFSQNIDAEVEEVEKMIKRIQRFDPPGVAAKDLQECLLIQLEDKIDKGEENNIEAKNLALKILEDYFEEFTKKHYQKLQRSLFISESQLKDAIDEILKLNPKPAATIDSARRNSTHYIVPDFIIHNRDGELELTLNNKNAPDLRINDQYLEMLKSYKHATDGRRSSKKEKEAIMFIKQKIDSAKWFIDAILQRQDTLFKTMYSIMQYQKEYFLTGDERRIKPMILKDIADITNLDISTISRVANSKFVQSEFGSRKLKSFFSESLQTMDGEEVSTLEVKNILEDIIAAENKKKPLSDEKLKDHLRGRGYNIARRTVAKYREQLNIPVARLRKEL
ncbi:RNA polymerase factor sigma-54 [Portibacter marinus]|uniref:RNA polymerase factor sigma-54 n=1 Tax=Portibacter marinus TaxID=2898660 RepID=UPI001F36F98C|nr:RNA polymerase factor sigma-54 [Portibacter marinus]